LSHENIRIPTTPNYYSVNQGYEQFWTPGVRAYVHWLQGLDEAKREPLALRYIGSMVADFHRNLLQGGVFLYPGDLRAPEGKMRLLFEAQALAFLVNQAGGYASDGIGSILDIQPHELHQRVPLMMGNRDLVETAENFIREYDQEWVRAYLPMRQGRAI
ncbi:MAG: fructose-1,6-bisphosphatase, partial [Anaerolineae bacterium]|nr:fructose-1,6-bisphosphatase [Anaerolineae bacterium]